MSRKLLSPSVPLVSSDGLISTNWWQTLQALTQIQVTFGTPQGTNFSADWSAADEIRITLISPIITITNIGASDGQQCLLTLIQGSGGNHLAMFTAETDF